MSTGWKGAVHPGNGETGEDWGGVALGWKVTKGLSIERIFPLKHGNRKKPAEIMQRPHTEASLYFSNRCGGQQAWNRESAEHEAERAAQAGPCKALPAS